MMIISNTNIQTMKLKYRRELNYLLQAFKSSKKIIKTQVKHEKQKFGKVNNK